ncbi:LysE family translocator [Streptomyces sp. NPDC086023]|uniref:LysE family translocator n=1 Tax=Streptomyces sp. NPDC086023 TaxID=3365746 RepID=UPI0037D5C645
MGGQLPVAAGVLALLTVVPGPDLALVTRQAVGSGPGDALRTVGGVAAGLLVWGALTVAGLAALLAASAGAALVVRVLGAAYLVVLGIGALRRGGRSAGTGPDPVAPAVRGNPWRTGLVGNLLNPKIAVFYTGLLPALAPAGLPPSAGMALLVTLHAGLTVAWLGGYVLLLSRARAQLSRPAVRRALDRLTGVVLIAFGLRLAASAR